MGGQEILRSTNVKALIICMTIATISVVARTGARLFKQQDIGTEDYFCWLALSCFLTMCGLYLTILGPVYLMEAVGKGLEAPPADFLDQVRFLMGRFYAIQLLFWITLWSVKLSLLFMFRRLLIGLPIYNRIWLGIVIFTVLAFVGCEISQLLSCTGGMKAYFTPGMLCTPNDTEDES
jgi:hypothetical protein